MKEYADLCRRGCTKHEHICRYCREPLAPGEGCSLACAAAALVRRGSHPQRCIICNRSGAPARDLQYAGRTMRFPLCGDCADSADECELLYGKQRYLETLPTMDGAA